LKKKVKDLEEELNKDEEGETCYKRPRAWCMSTMAIVAVLVPLISFVSLFLLGPNFVMTVQNGSKKRNIRKTLFWTGI